jgi:hypothetical protein
VVLCDDGREEWFVGNVHVESDGWFAGPGFKFGAALPMVEWTSCWWLTRLPLWSLSPP